MQYTSQLKALQFQWDREMNSTDREGIVESLVEEVQAKMSEYESLRCADAWEIAQLIEHISPDILDVLLQFYTVR